MEQASGRIKEGPKTILFKNIVWARPLAVVDNPVQVQIELFPEEQGEIAYEIYSKPRGLTGAARAQPGQSRAENNGKSARHRHSRFAGRMPSRDADRQRVL